jgi:hypothetical protein
MWYDKHVAKPDVEAGSLADIEQRLPITAVYRRLGVCSVL